MIMHICDVDSPAHVLHIHTRVLQRHRGTKFISCPVRLREEIGQTLRKDNSCCCGCVRGFAVCLSAVALIAVVSGAVVVGSVALVVLGAAVSALAVENFAANHVLLLYTVQ